MRKAAHYAGKPDAEEPAPAPRVPTPTVARTIFQEHHAEHYRRHGYVVVENFLTPDELAAARSELTELLPGWVEFCDDPTHDKPKDWNAPRAPGQGPLRFPYAGTALNAITLHPELRRFAADRIGHDDLFCEQSHLHVKCKGHHADRDQVMHCDFGNHTLAYPPLDPAYWQTAYLVYYTDVDADHAPTAVCSWEHYPERIRWPAHYTREERPDIYDNEVPVTVLAGSLLAYSMRTFHRGTPFRADVGRIGQFITYAPAAWKWLGITGWSVEATRPEFRAWIEGATPDERTALGFPAPGHGYWTEETLEGVAARYPGMDMTPYRDAVAD